MPPKSHKDYMDVYLAAIAGLSSRVDILNPWQIPKIAHDIADAAIADWRAASEQGKLPPSESE